MKQIQDVSYLKILFVFSIVVLLMQGKVFAQAAELKQGVVKIKGYDQKGGSLKQTGTGACIYISENRKLYVLTANHVVFQDGFPVEHLALTFQGSDVDYDAKIYRSYKGIDVAVLVLDNYPSNVRILELGTSKDVQDFQNVYGWGYPGGGIIKAFQGTVSAPSEDKIFLNNIDLAPGNSGGPLMSKKTDKIIGIILQKAADQTDEYARAIDFFVIYLRNDNVLKKVFTNEVSEVKIGNQVWMDKNLDVSRYRNGDPILEVKDPKAWENLTTGAWCYYENKSANGKIYGKLYNWYAVNDPRGLAPEDWHVPTDKEWTVLTDYLGGEEVAGGKLKETWFSHWKNPNYGSTNEFGFAALPGGDRNYDGTFYNIGERGFWWSATKSGTNTAWSRYVYYDYRYFFRGGTNKGLGFSVRCVRH